VYSIQVTQRTNTTDNIIFIN